MEICFVIKQYRVSDWFYFDADNEWHHNVYMADKFKSYEAAETYLRDRLSGGIFQIEKIFISR